MTTLTHPPKKFSQSAEILSKQTILTAHVFDVQQVHFRLPDGRERNFHIVDHVDAVTILPVDQDGNVWFVTQFRVGAECELLELPAGVMDAGEAPIETARRELREEIGMDCRELIPLGGFWMAAGYSNEYMHCFLAKDLTSAPLEQDEDEFLKLSTIPIATLDELIHNGKVQDGKSLSTWLLAKPHLMDYLAK